jgi:hypothetical protein
MKIKITLICEANKPMLAEIHAYKCDGTGDGFHETLDFNPNWTVSELESNASKFVEDYMANRIITPKTSIPNISSDDETS